MNLLMAIRIDGYKVFLPKDPLKRSSWVRDITAQERVVMPVVVPGELEDCFDSSLDPFENPVSFFTGPKGVGKSTFLLLKRSLIEGADRETGPAFKDIKCLPEGIYGHAFVAAQNSSSESLAFENPALLGQYSEAVMWELVWTFLFSLFIIQAEITRINTSQAIGAQRQRTDDARDPAQAGKARDFAIPDEARQLIGIASDEEINGKDFWRYLKRIVLESGATKARLKDIYEKQLLRLVRQAVVHHRYCLFLDAIDEHLKDERNERLLRSVHFPDRAARDPEDEPAEEVRNYDVWANAQTSLLGAGSKLYYDSDRRIKLYSSLRSEAYHSMKGGVAEQQRGEYCAQIHYEQRHLKVIAHANILVDETKWNGKAIKPDYDPNGKPLKTEHDQSEANTQLVAQSLESFFGRDSSNINETGKRESWIDCMIRHTMERPRELMLIGMNMGKKQCPSLATMNPEQRLDLIQAQARTIVKDFLEFLGDPLLWSDLESILGQVSSNVLTHQELEDVSNDVALATAYRLMHPFCRLHALGLLGSIEKADTGKPMQRFDFHAVDVRGSLEESLPAASPYYLLHPLLHCLAKGMSKKRAYHMEQQCFIGHGLPWKDVKSASRIVVSRQVDTVRVEFNGRPIMGPGIASELDRLRDMRDRRIFNRSRRFELPNRRASVFLLTCLLTMYTNETSKVAKDEFLTILKKMTATGIVASMLPYESNGQAAQRQSGKRTHTADTMVAIWEEIHNDYYVMTEIRSHLRAHIGDGVLLSFSLDGDSGIVTATGFSGAEISVRGFADGLS
jgi:hypothetical protein